MRQVFKKNNPFRSLRMKKYWIIIIFVGSLGVLNSCDDYLQTESRSKFTEDTSFDNLDFATKMVNGIYANIASTVLYDYYLMYYKFDTDIEFSINNDDGGSMQLAHYAGNEGSATLKNVWSYLYQTIERANICIDNLPRSTIWTGENETKAKALYGEAVTLRALCYYELITNWGDVPFLVKSTQSGDNFYQPKIDRDSIYEYLIQDLLDVQAYVPWMAETQTTERISKAFVKGLRARMALTYAGYSLRNGTFETRRGRYWEDYYKIANNECREIIESKKHQLNPSFENIFKLLHAYTQDMTYKEILFDVAFGRLYSGRLGRFLGMPFSSKDTKYGVGLNQFRVGPCYYYSFDREDTRRNVSVELYDYNNVNTASKQSLISDNSLNFWPCKWRRSWLSPTMGGSYKDAGYTGVNFPLMRYSDILLMYAETENEINNGPTPAAKEALSLVRRRAMTPNSWQTTVVNYVDSVSLTKTNFFNAIVDERAWEFGGGELYRKVDLVRWNLLGAKLDQMKTEWRKIFNDDPTYIHHSKVPTYIFWKYNNDGETIDILNPDTRLPSTSIPGYTRNAWIPLMSESRKVVVGQNIDKIAHGFDKTKNNHLLPISADIISASNGVLSNDQMP
ncbi:MAG: RagB/SusD family nutrient uptake outer membrane protein [Paludibacter sp.]|nr:RagB/SusD family nutrient uptake outer membrane protein [Paludibacter sp.]